MNLNKSYFIVILLFSHSVFSQAILKATGSTDTYGLINSVLAPGYNVVEVPDCNHNSFGRHIDEIFDNTLNSYVFRFLLHTTPDNDRCINFDRQRNEIKTYDKSPDSLLGVKGEQFIYTWKFKIDANFQPSSSFTHLHQLKAVGGSEDSMPLITFTARKASPDRLELRYAETTSQTTLKTMDLSLIKGKWIEVIETVLYEDNNQGRIKIELTNIETGATVFSYENNAIRMWKTDAEFVRPKWGIYRSLNDSANLRDEQVLFADFSIKENKDPVLAIAEVTTNAIPFVFPNPVNDNLNLSDMALLQYQHIDVYDIQGRTLVSQLISTKQFSVKNLPKGLFLIKLSGVSATPILLKILKI